MPAALAKEIDQPRRLHPCQCRAARGLLDWTQDMLAAEAGLSRSTVRDFEQGRHALHRASEWRLAAALERAGVVLLAGGPLGPGVQLGRGTPAASGEPSSDEPFHP